MFKKSAKPNFGNSSNKKTKVPPEKAAKLSAANPAFFSKKGKK